ncbi:hypothetical protein BDA99DRAFT_571212 [Phascolomyces articulosus]|uniref:Uncharacterized protein n=1 Tax=Phascolomyces articulosus TaxID=60185 RepID=A0AAD5KHY1_9FUNG|nr:hypothetical protein BDA99DRAFT_571212 [Phascolomyces articulosus]
MNESTSDTIHPRSGSHNNGDDDCVALSFSACGSSNDERQQNTISGQTRIEDQQYQNSVHCDPTTPDFLDDNNSTTINNDYLLDDTYHQHDDEDKKSMTSTLYDDGYNEHYRDYRIDDDDGDYCYYDDYQEEGYYDEYGDYHYYDNCEDNYGEYEEYFDEYGYEEDQCYGDYEEYDDDVEEEGYYGQYEEYYEDDDEEEVCYDEYGEYYDDEEGEYYNNEDYYYYFEEEEEKENDDDAMVGHAVQNLININITDTTYYTMHDQTAVDSLASTVNEININGGNNSDDDNS